MTEHDALAVTVGLLGDCAHPTSRGVCPDCIAEAVMPFLARAWDEGNRHESEYLDTWGQFDPNPVNPYRVAPPGAQQ